MKMKLKARTHFALIGALVALVGCMKDPELKPNFGPESSAAEFSQKMATIESPSPFTMKKDELSSMTSSTVLADQVYQLNRRTILKVNAAGDSGSDYLVTYSKEIHEFLGGDEKISASERDIRIAKSAATTASISPFSLINDPLAGFDSGIQKLTALERITHLTPQAYKTFSADNRTTFHNLTVEKGTTPVPDFVQQRTDCGGFNSQKCRSGLKTYIVKFDQVDWSGDSGQRVSVMWMISPDVPYSASAMFPKIGGLIKSCASAQVPYQGQRVKVTQCDEIKDFTFGHD